MNHHNQKAFPDPRRDPGANLRQANVDHRQANMEPAFRPPRPPMTPRVPQPGTARLFSPSCPSPLVPAPPLALPRRAAGVRRASDAFHLEGQLPLRASDAFHLEGQLPLRLHARTLRRCSPCYRQATPIVELYVPGVPRLMITSLFQITPIVDIAVCVVWSS